MNCAQFELIAGDIAAGRRELAGPAWVHAARCADCQERLFAERNLQSTLSGLRRELVAARPPDELELALVRRFAARSAAVAPSAARPARGNWLVLGAIAASVVLSFALVLAGSQRLHAPDPGARLAAVSPPSARQVVISSRQDGNGVVRVHMPRAAPALLGLPFAPRRAQETVAAELLVDNAGIVTAVRIVR